MFTAGRIIFSIVLAVTFLMVQPTASGKDQNRCSRIEFELSLRVYGRGTKLLPRRRAGK